ncbi:H-2 class II histocompatibility antigen, A-F beta chain-like isoform X2 [Phascolarctos cinereus]|uniref:RLA class I histocompatibility antigen, alpha chain 11/11-like isoform X2 n=1 Tax=Phascolarctos cinereus TaxID=38626 RepID=A0A6P5LFB5_PHACI|nr:RLA class I histocompatibility antigen, alpha chain 11/11-like isoform X2 [Phascolarctos cinereus]
MEYQRRSRWLSSAWLLILGAFTLRDTQAVHHKHVAQFTVVGSAHSLLELREISFMDDIQVASYNNIDQQITIKIPWLSIALGVDSLTEIQNLFMFHEQDINWIFQYFPKNDTYDNRNYTGQLLADCEIDNDIKVKSLVHLIWEGEEYYRIDEEVGYWENVKPEFKKYEFILESPFWTDLRKRYMNYYCVDLLRKIAGFSSLRDNVPPEVTVSRRVNREGSIILSCTATGFYPRSILLHWEKDGKLGVWGKETSTGTLPNADSTFYLRVTLELPPEDSGMGYTCVVEHIELKTPAVYPVPEKPTREKPWVLTLGIVLAVILLLSCAGAFIARKKRQSGLHVFLL